MGCFTALQILLVQVSSFGANPLMLPGLESWINGFIEEEVMTPFTYPAGIPINIAKLWNAAATMPVERPKGLLMVTVHSASGLPKTDFFGLCDPYVKYDMHMYINIKRISTYINIKLWY